MNHSTLKIGRYITEIQKIVEEKMDYLLIDNTGRDMMSVTLETAQGKKTIVLFFNLEKGFMTANVLYNQFISPEHRDKIIFKFQELNRSNNPAMGYDYPTNKCNLPTFCANHKLEYDDPADDPGLDDFCTLIFKTAPTCLDEVVGAVTKE